MSPVSKREYIQAVSLLHTTCDETGTGRSGARAHPHTHCQVTAHPHPRPLL
jgi:hypothetical protein